MVLARHGLEGLGSGQLSAQHRQQRPQQLGLLLAGIARGTNQPVQHRQQHAAGDRSSDAGLPGNRQRDAQIDQRIEQHRRHLGAVLEGFRRALRLGGHRVGQPPDRLLQVMRPARRNHRADQRQPHVGGDVGHGVAHLTIGQQGQRRLEADERGGEHQQHRRGGLQTQELGHPQRDLFRHRRRLVAGARGQRQHGQQHRQTQPVHQARRKHRRQPGRASAGIGAHQRGDHRQRPAACRLRVRRRRCCHGLMKRRRGPALMTTGRLGSVSNASPSSE